MLSERLKTIASMVPKSDTLADVGCDHGFLSIELVKTGVAKHVLAMDINEGPLEKAKQNIAMSGCSDQITCLLSDGLNVVTTTKLDGFIIAGMGGRLGLKIIYDRRDLMPLMKWAIISLQSELDLVRLVLDMWNVKVTSDITLKDGKKFYTVLKLDFESVNINDCDDIEKFFDEMNDKLSSMDVSDKALYRYGSASSKEYILSELQRYESIKKDMINKGITDSRVNEVIDDIAICNQALHN